MEGLLPAGRTVSGATAEPGPAAPCVGGTAPGAVYRRRGPADQQPQRLVVWSLLVTLGQRLGVERPKHRTAGRIDHSDDRLRPAGGVEHQTGVTAHDVYEVTDCDVLHGQLTGRWSLIGFRRSLDVVHDLGGA